MDKKEYHAPEIETVFFDSEDIITANTGGKSGHDTRLPFVSGSGLF